MPLPSSWVDSLFARLSVRYGAAWLRMWEGIDIAAVKADWAKELGEFATTPDAIAYGLDHLPTERPPNVSQFRVLCRQAVIRPVYQALPAPDVIDKPKVDAIVEDLRRRFVGGKRRRIEQEGAQ